MHVKLKERETNREWGGGEREKGGDARGTDTSPYSFYGDIHYIFSELLNPEWSQFLPAGSSFLTDWFGMR